MIKKTALFVSLFFANLCFSQNSDTIIQIIENKKLTDSTKLISAFRFINRSSLKEAEMKRIYKSKSVKRWLNQLLKKTETINFFISIVIERYIRQDYMNGLAGFQDYKNSPFYLESEKFDSIFVKKFIITLSNENIDKLLNRSTIDDLLINLPYPSAYAFAKKHKLDRVLRFLGSKKAWRGIDLESEISEKTQKYFRDEYIELQPESYRFITMPKYYIQFTHLLLNEKFTFNYEVISESVIGPFNEYILWEYGFFLKKKGFDDLWDFTNKNKKFSDFLANTELRKKLSEFEAAYIKECEVRNRYWSKKLWWQKLIE